MKQGQYEVSQTTLIGDRSLNQDRCTCVEAKESLLLALADGMGGHPKGEVAAQTLIETCEDAFSKARKPLVDPEQFLSHILYQAHEEIIAFGQRQSPPIKPRTTAVIALIQGGQVYFAHCGDSRFYLFRNGEVYTRTRDHSYVEFLHQQGAISATACEDHPYRNYVTRCLGGSDNSIEVSSGSPIPLQTNDVLLLCSDGLWGALSDDLLARTLATSSTSLKEITGNLTQTAASTAYPESDNVTAVAVRWLQGKPNKTQSAPKKKTTPSDKGDDELTQAINDLQDLIDLYDPNSNQEKK
jgi:serine/threonine protein phosphatase PrpC